MTFHLAWFSLTLSDIERSIQVTRGFPCPISPNLFKITTVTIDDRKEVIYEISNFAIVFDLERSIQVTQVFNDLYLQIYSR